MTEHELCMRCEKKKKENVLDVTSDYVKKVFRCKRGKYETGGKTLFSRAEKGKCVREWGIKIHGQGKESKGGGYFFHQRKLRVSNGSLEHPKRECLMSWTLVSCLGPNAQGLPSLLGISVPAT